MQIRKVIDRRIRGAGGGVDIAGDVTAAIAANVAEPGGSVASSAERIAAPSRSTASPSPEPESNRPRRRHRPSSAREEPHMDEQYRTLTREELEDLAGEPLPERAAMSLVNANLAIPINAAVAANVLSDDAVAYANAQQYTPIDQSS
jgi:hypothetical protein